MAALEDTDGRDDSFMTVTAITARERSALASLIRRRERLARAEVEQRAAALVADFERQLATIYSWADDDVWSEAEAAADKAVEAAQAIIGTRCKQLGIPKDFAPSISFYWSGRGENALAARRVELRKVAMAKINAMKREAQTAIETHAITLQTQLVSESLTTAAARRFLARMPEVQALMPTLDARKLLTGA